MPEKCWQSCCAMLIYTGWHARVVELVDSLDSGSSVHSGRGGSSPPSRTKKKDDRLRTVIFLFIRGTWTRGLLAGRRGRAATRGGLCRSTGQVPPRAPKSGKPVIVEIAGFSFIFNALRVFLISRNWNIFQEIERYSNILKSILLTKCLRKWSLKSWNMAARSSTPFERVPRSRRRERKSVDEPPRRKHCYTLQRKRNTIFHWDINAFPVYVVML